MDTQARAPEFTSVLVVRCLSDNRRYALIEDLAEYELIAYRQHMVAARRRPAAVTINRIMEMSDLELGLQALLGRLPSGHR